MKEYYLMMNNRKKVNLEAATKKLIKHLLIRPKNIAAQVIVYFIAVVIKPHDLYYQSKVFFPEKEERIIWVRPRDVGFTTPQGRGINNLPHRFIVDGEWDIKNKYPRDMHQTIKELFIDGMPYQQCTQYLMMKENMEKGYYGGSYWCKTLAEIDQYFFRLIDAYEDIKQNGYKLQVQLGQPVKDEIRGYVDRFGDLMIGGGGNHRLAIAEILDIPLVPFLVRQVHYQWVKSLVELHQCDVRTAVRIGLAALGKNEA